MHRWSGGMLSAVDRARASEAGQACVFMEQPKNSVAAQVDCRGTMRFARVFQARLWVVFIVFLVAHATVAQVFAEVRTVNGRGSYRMGDHDTKDDAVRLAVEAAKRNALEQVVTYVESVTSVKGMDVTKDEIRTFTAGLVLVLDQHIATKADHDTVVVEVDLLAQIDTEEAAHAIATLRKNEDVRGQLAELKRENERLHRELNSASRALAEVPLPGQPSPTMERRREILYRVESNAMVSQAWTDWALASASSASDRWMGRANIQGLLQAARERDPASPHIARAERTMTAKQPPTPPEPPSPPLSGQRRPRMPRHEVVARPGVSGMPRTLNEVIYSMPVRPTQGGDRFPSQVEQGQHGQAGSNIPMESGAGEHTQAQ